MESRDGPRPVPNDETIQKFLEEAQLEDWREMSQFREELRETINQTVLSGEPRIFAYGKLMKTLRTREDMTEPKLIRMLCAAMWELE